MRYSLLPVFLLTACSVTPDYSQPEIPIEGTYYSQSRAEERTRLSASWWRAFDDSILNRLVGYVASDNLDLAAAAARIDQADAQKRIAGATLKPTLGLDGSVQRLRQSEDSLNPVGISIPGGGGVAGVYETLYQANLTSGWEIDIFGRNRRLIEAAGAGAEAAAWDYEDLRISLQSEIGQSYVRYRVIEARRREVEKNLALRERTSKISRDRNENGAASGLDVARSQNAVDVLNAQLPALVAAGEAEITAMAALSNRSSGDIKSLVSGKGGMPSPRRLVGTGIPSDLLKTRPDIRAAERRLAQATAQRNVATANLYPRFSLIGSLATEAISSGDLFQKSATKFAVGPSLSLPISQGGRLRGEITAAEAGVEAQLAAYEQSINSAIKEVERAAIAFQQARSETRGWAAAVKSAENAYRISNVQYDAEALPLERLLDAEEALNSTELQLIAAEGKTATSLIQLGRALGGGWGGK